MKRLTRVERGRISIGPSIALGALLVALCALPATNAAGPIDESLAVPRAELALPTRLHYPKAEVRRDPFVPSDDTPVAAPGLEDAVAGIVLPPNAGAAPTAPTNGTVLRGVLLGSRPGALVETQGRIALVRIGSPLLGSTVSSIRAGGITLDDGESLRFAEKRP